MSDPQTFVVFEANEKVSLSIFADDLAFEFSDVSYDTINNFLLRAITRMAHKGNILRRRIQIATQAHVENYLLEPPDCVEIIAIMEMCDTQGRLCGNVRRLTSEPCRLPCGTYSWFEAPNIIHISPSRCNMTYTVIAAVAPVWDACEVDRILLTHYYEVVIAGAKYYLYGMAHKPWASNAKAQEFKNDFELGIAAAGIEARLGGQRGPLKIKRLYM